MNSVNLIGRLTSDPELRYTQGGMAVVKVSIAVDRNLSKEKKTERVQNGEQTADFPRITFLGKQAETVAQYLKKGKRISVEGRISTSSYKNSDDKTVYVTEVFGEKFGFLDSVKDNGSLSVSSDVEIVDGAEDFPF